MTTHRSLRAFLAVVLAFGSVNANAGLLDRIVSIAPAPQLRVIVQLQPGVNASRVLRLLNGVVLDEIPGAGTYLVSLPSLPLILPRGIAFIEPNRTISIGNDPTNRLLSVSSRNQPHWYASQPSFRIVHSPEAQSYSIGTGVVVASIDARFDFSHPALVGHLTNGWDFVADSATTSSSRLSQSSTSFMFDNGTPALQQSSASFMFGNAPALTQSSTSFMFENKLYQSSTSFMFGDGSLLQSSTSFMFEDPLFQSSTSFMFEQLDNLGISSPSAAGAGLTHGTFTTGVIVAIAPGAMVMPLRAFDDDGNADIFTLAKAIRYAVDQGADAINMSWGTAEDTGTLRSAIAFAWRKGVAMIAAAGNMNNSTRYYPAAYSEVIAVAATDELDRKASFSSFGTHVAVSAPGVNIISAMPDGKYGVKSGTSFAAPIVSGQVAQLLALQLVDTEERVVGTAVRIDKQNPGYAKQLGSGRVDLLKSISR